jgi:hypothetical protein
MAHNCKTVLPGGCSCQNQIEKNRCEVLTGNTPTCAGKIGVAGANLDLAKEWRDTAETEKKQKQVS